MPQLKQRVEAELANIERTLSDLPEADALPGLSALEIAGTAALLHSFYTGVENVLKQVVRARRLEMPAGDSWHRDLVNLACAEKVVSEATASQLRQYLAFRHFFGHGYAIDLQLERLQPLIEAVRDVYARFRRDIKSVVDAPEDDH